MRAIRVLAGPVLLLLFFAGCDSDPDDRPYLEFVGGGFVFNYRIATADYGFVAKVVKELPAGATVEAQFENPSGGAPIVLRQPVTEGQAFYTFRTPPLQGVEAERDYRVELRLLAPDGGEAIATYTRSYRSQVSQEILPEAPLVVGPGYQQPPENAPEPAKSN